MASETTENQSDSRTELVAFLVSKLPRDASERDTELLLDSVFSSEMDVAAKHGVSRSTVTRAKAKYRDAYNSLLSNKNLVLSSFAALLSYRLMGCISAGLSTLKPPSTSQSIAALVQSVTQLVKLSESAVRALPVVEVKFPSLEEIDKALAAAEALGE